MKENTGFRELLNSMMKRRWYITALVLGSFILIIGGIFGAITSKTSAIDYWFSDTDKDKMLVQKMDEEDGVSLSNTGDMPNTPIEPTDVTPIVLPTTEKQIEKIGVEIDEDGDGVMDGLDFDGDGVIDEYFAHRQCEHVWGDSDNNGEEECLVCGKIKDVE